MKLFKFAFLFLLLPAWSFATGGEVLTPCGYEITFTITDVKCHGDSTGGIVTNVAGTGTYTYRWADESVTSNVRSNIPAETYFVTVTDQLGCKVTEFATVTEPDPLEIKLEKEDVLCFESATGRIDLTVFGGTKDYQYNWSEGSISQDLNNITAGDYTVRVTDANSCIIDGNTTIIEPLELTSSSSVTNVLCHGGDDGRIETFVFGGTAPFRFSWNNGEVTSEIFDLSASTYTRTITDENGCKLTEQVIVTEPLAFASSFEVVPVTCNNNNDGEIDLTINGGTKPYRFTWSNSELVLGEDTEDLTGLPQEKYKVQVTDTNNCVHFDSIEVTQPQVLVTNINFKPVTCFNGSDGEAYFSVSGGTEPYSYLWSNDEITSDVLNLTAGEYSVVVADSNGCIETAEIEVTQAEEIIIESDVTIVSCKDDQDGAIDCEASGGRGELAFEWASGNRSEDLEGLFAGDYTVTVTDDSLCTAEKTITVDVNPRVCIEIPSAFSPNEDNINDTWVITNSELYPELSLEVYSTTGRKVFVTNGYDTSNLWDGTFKGKELPSGTYYYILLTNNGDEPFTGGISIIR